MIIDWDYHHGNATEAMFYDDPSVLYFSTHDQFAYPGTGDPAKKGIGKGLGLILMCIFLVELMIKRSLMCTKVFITRSRKI